MYVACIETMNVPCFAIVFVCLFVAKRACIVIYFASLYTHVW